MTDGIGQQARWLLGGSAIKPPPVATPDRTKTPVPDEGEILFGRI